ncbi:carbonic anhydrase [Piedraia hortae CBS 480.64]|uniref:Carbonic anhydrase n=1 Tax=Piedraia hortae CBS 480.64 TaxID=1314780 RepID=A0A6A7C6Z0_9PEZI|nr:carbonic anhydrase [Piedraia hortae CBS 480.64]
MASSHPSDTFEGVPRLSPMHRWLKRRRLDELQSPTDRVFEPPASPLTGEKMASENVKNVQTRNEKYASSFSQGSLAGAPAKKYAIVTCMDARLDPAAAFGIELGDAHVIRNAGGNAQDALRSLIISQNMLGTREVMLIKHTKCGMLTFENPDARKLVCEACGNDAVADDYDFQPFKDLDEGVKADVKMIKNCKALVDKSKVSGWVYEVETGKVRQVV